MAQPPLAHPQSAPGAGHCVPGMELSKIDQILCRNFMDFNV